MLSTCEICRRREIEVNRFEKTDPSVFIQRDRRSGLGRGVGRV